MNNIHSPIKTDITTWRQFTEKVRKEGYRLLSRLDNFPGAVLVSGCQRSGTTMLARIITQSEGMVNYWFGPDDELDAALILSGYVAHETYGRYCFQTTYLDDHYHEYFDHNNFQLIWVLRNPLSVVYSLLYNWEPTALNGTFPECGAEFLTGLEKWKYQVLGAKSIDRAKKACLLYNSKTYQLLNLMKVFGPNNIMVVDYDHLVNEKYIILSKIYKWINLEYRKEYADQIHAMSLNKRNQLSPREASCVIDLSQGLYEEVRAKLVQ